MVNDRVHAALSRIDAALDRIEAQPRTTPPSLPITDPDLADRHERLRAQTAAALARLDRLLGTEDQA